MNLKTKIEYIIEQYNLAIKEEKYHKAIILSYDLTTATKVLRDSK